MTPLTYPCLPERITAELIGRDVYLTFKSESWTDGNREMHSERVWRYHREELEEAIEELPAGTPRNVFIAALPKGSVVSDTVKSVLIMEVQA